MALDLNPKILLLPFLLWASIAVAHPTPCEGVEEVQPPPQAKRLGHIASVQLKMPNVKVTKTFRFRGWEIVLAEPEEADSAYLFYAGTPSPANYRAFWAGAAGPNDQGEILAWVKTAVRGIPIRLSQCFSFRVTHP